MVPLNYYLIVSSLLFALALVGIIIHRKNVIILLMCIELILLAVNTNFVAFSHYLGENSGEVFVFFILTVAASEAAIGLAIVMLLYRNRGNIDIDTMNVLKG